MENSKTLKSQVPQNSSNSSNSLSKKQIPLKKQIILKLVNDWHSNFYKQRKDIDTCFDQFRNKYSQTSKLKIKFDNSVSSVLADLSKQIDFLQFNDEKQNQMKKTLEMMNQILKQKRFISQRQYEKFKNQQFLSSPLEEYVETLKSNLEDLGYIKDHQVSSQLNRKNYSQKQKEQLINIWSISIIVRQQVFWKFILQQKLPLREVKDIIPIFKIYDYLIKEMSIDLREQIISYIKQILQKKKQEKNGHIRELQTSIIKYDDILDMKAQQISAYLNKQRWQKYTEQYQILTDFLLQRCNNKMIRFQPYGSFQSKFYIINYSDIDIGLYYDGSYYNKRQNIEKLLKKIQACLESDHLQIANYRYSEAKTAHIIKVPFVKIYYKDNFGTNLDVVPTMDIIINNKEGMENSKMLSLYAQNQFILKFCNLIKYWASKRDLINLKSKFYGLSSYGIVLMCLYYLMVTNQIPYLKKNGQNYEIGQKDFCFKEGFLNNFIGFLKFYSTSYKCLDTDTLKIGKFHSEKLIVCLIQNHDGLKMYQDSIIINMYDFIDGSNPGRMRKPQIGKFERIFEQTLQCLEDRSLSFVQKIFSDETKQSKAQFYVPKRGNRFNNQ